MLIFHFYRFFVKIKKLNKENQVLILAIVKLWWSIYNISLNQWKRPATFQKMRTI